MARIKYYYNTESCEFEKAVVTWKTSLKTIGTYTAFGSLIAGVVIGSWFFFVDTPKEKILKDKNTALMASIVRIDQELDVLEDDVNDLHEKDNDFYRAVFAADEIKPEVWAGATGGNNENQKFGHQALSATEAQLKQLQAKIGIQNQSLEKLTRINERNKEQRKHTPSIRPVKNDIVSGFGKRRHPILGVTKMHTGIDFAAKMGTPVYAVADGKVTFAGVHENGYGKHINLNHGYGYATKYAHLSKFVVSKGDRIKRGDIIGYTGNTGLSKGPHLHYEISRNGVKINPVDYFYSDVSPEEYVALKKDAENQNESMD